MAQRVVVAGSTGDLGQRIVKALVARGADVVTLVRAGSAQEKTDALQALGAAVRETDLASVEDVAVACEGAECVVSALAGLHDVIVKTQTVLLQGAIKAGVPRFIPSDFSTDFTVLPSGENRNFDLRREFHETLDASPIASTAIFNGAFAEVLKHGIPVLDFGKKTVGYWDDAEHVLDFTTMDDTAAFTAAVALDASAPKALHIASFQVTPNDFIQFTTAVLGTPYELVDMGSLEDLRAKNIAARAANPEGEQELYCRWQQGQYMQSMFSTTHPALDNARYPELTWTTLAEAVQLGA